MQPRSLRAKLVVAAAGVTLALLALVSAISVPLLDAGLRSQAELRLRTTGHLLQAALISPLAERDYATLERILAEIVADRAIDYAVVRDARNQVVLQTGAAGAGGTLEAEEIIAVAGQKLGSVRFGASAAFVAEARAELLRRAAVGGVLAGAFALLLMLFMAYRLTRPLVQLTEAASAIGAGNFAAPLPPRGGDEIGRLSGALRAMADALGERMHALAESEALQREYLARALGEHARLAALLNAMRIGVVFVGRDGRIVYANPAFRAIWLLAGGFDPVGRTLAEALGATVYGRGALLPFLEHAERAAAEDGAADSIEAMLSDGRMIAQLTSRVDDRGGGTSGRLWLYEDVTVARRAAQLAYLAERDALTGLYNRRGFQRELEQMISQAKRRGEKVALFFVDLDGFKEVNDAFGHRRGDELLVSIVGRLQAQVREHEVLARLGGDEFAVLASGTHADEFRVLAERIVGCLRAGFSDAGAALRTTCSVGVAMYPDHADTSEALLLNTDAAMYGAKEAGKNCWRFYAGAGSCLSERVQHLMWKERIAAAIERDELQFAVQGVYEAKRHDLAYYELLARLPDPEGAGALLQPSQFIPIAEKTGQIVALDRRVILRAVALLAGNARVPGLAVNLSGRSLGDCELPAFIAAQLRARGVAPARLHIELTETSTIPDLRAAGSFIEELRRAGCRTCLDDFGSGFSSFACLKLLPIDVIKIDGLFIRSLANDADSQLLVRAIIDIARGLKKLVVAEGVEDAKSFEHLRAWGVDYVQGYYFDRPRLIAGPAEGALAPIATSARA